ncbi:MAG: hypothetical protein ACK5LJ_08180 [Paracoccus sp. (in: a-proteobacteria)]
MNKKQAIEAILSVGKNELGSYKHAEEAMRVSFTKKLYKLVSSFARCSWLRRSNVQFLAMREFADLLNCNDYATLERLVKDYGKLLYDKTLEVDRKTTIYTRSLKARLRRYKAVTVQKKLTATLAATKNKRDYYRALSVYKKRHGNHTNLLNGKTIEHLHEIEVFNHRQKELLQFHKNQQEKQTYARKMKLAEKRYSKHDNSDKIIEDVKNILLQLDSKTIKKLAFPDATDKELALQVTSTDKEKVTLDKLYPRQSIMQLSQACKVFQKHGKIKHVQFYDYDFLTANNMDSDDTRDLLAPAWGDSCHKESGAYENSSDFLLNHCRGSFFIATFADGTYLRLYAYELDKGLALSDCYAFDPTNETTLLNSNEIIVRTIESLTRYRSDNPFNSALRGSGVISETVYINSFATILGTPKTTVSFYDLLESYDNEEETNKCNCCNFTIDKDEAYYYDLYELFPYNYTNEICCKECIDRYLTNSKALDLSEIIEKADESEKENLLYEMNESSISIYDALQSNKDLLSYALH